MSGILVIVEKRNGALTRASLEALAAGQLLAKSLAQDCFAAVMGDASDLAAYKLAGVFSISHVLLERYTSDAYTIALEQLIRSRAPAYVVFPHSYQVRDYAPALATRFAQELIPDVIAFREGPVFVRQLFQGRLNADYGHAGDGPCFVSVQAGSFRAEALETGNEPAKVEVFEPSIDAEQVRTRPSEPFREAAQGVDLSSAQIIVSVGRGIGEQENIPLVRELAEALGAELAASRPICDAGWVPMERQVGSSGQTVAPKLYVAVGISGAIQHLVGMKGAKNVVAINKDANAPIFEVADYGIEGDLFEIVPALTEAVRRVRSSR